jgi:hypothetical protein
MSAPINGLLSRLEGVRETGRGRWLARCPAHADRSPSLSIAEGDDGRILLFCHAGCGAADIVAGVGLELRDLFPPRPGATGDVTTRDGHRQSRMRCGLTAREATALLARDAGAVALAAANIAAGTAMTAEDVRLLGDIAARIRRAWAVRA